MNKTIDKTKEIEAPRKYCEYVPVYFVDHSTDCSYAHKAVNVQNKNGKVMLIASDSNIIEQEYNIDDLIEKPSFFFK